MAEPERRGIDRLVGIVFVVDLAVFLALVYLFGGLVAGVWAIVSLVEILALSVQRLPRG